MTRAAKLASVKDAQSRTISRGAKIQFLDPKGWIKTNESLATVVGIKTTAAKNVWLQSPTRGASASCQKIGAETSCLPKDVNFAVVMVVIQMRMSRDHLQVRPVINRRKVKMRVKLIMNSSRLSTMLTNLFLGVLLRLNTI